MPPLLLACRELANRKDIGFSHRVECLRSMLSASRQSLHALMRNRNRAKTLYWWTHTPDDRQFLHVTCLQSKIGGKCKNGHAEV